MKFSLLLYTQDWEAGPTIELSHIPQPGNVIMIRPKPRREETEMYYVDNVMFPEAGIEREDTIYLFVRPYTGYNKYAPMTESDRITEKLGKIAELLKELTEDVGEMSGSTSRLEERSYQLVENIEGARQDVTGELQNLSYIMEEVKEKL